jgi:hypothetical protein
MAIFKSGPTIGAISGNLGSVCFVHGRGSKGLRKAKRNTVSRSNDITKARATFANSQRRWRTLSTEQQQAWRTYANNNPVKNRLGETSNLSGYQMYVKIQMNAFDELGFFSDDPPLANDQSQQGELVITSSVSLGQRIQFPGYTNVEFTQVRIKAVSLWTDSVPKFAKGFRNTALFQFFSGPNPATGNFTNSWNFNFLPPVLGQVVAFRTSYLSIDHVEWGAYTQIVVTTA